MLRAPILALALLLSVTAQADLTLIRAGRLIDTDAGRVLSDQSILVRDGVIEAVGPSLPVPAGARLVDLSGYTVLPGLMDAHTHLVGDANQPDPLNELQVTAAQRALQSIPNARAVLMSAVVCSVPPESEIELVTDPSPRFPLVPMLTTPP